MKIENLHVIINPASGSDKPVLSILNAAFGPAAFKWEAKVTTEDTDAAHFAREALEAGVDAVAVYGGDGTVMEVASVLAGTDIPMAIIPGGTANIFSLELSIPTHLEEACALLCGDAFVVRDIDVGKSGDRVFLTRIGIGLESTVIQQTDREQKDRLGSMAYVLNALKELVNPQMALYRITMDGKLTEIEGLMCIVANSGVLSALPGRKPLSFAPNMSIDDGLLDVAVIHQGNLAALLEMAATMVAGNEDAAELLHWQVREVTVESDPPQPCQVDGDIIGNTPVTASVWPQALKVIVPVPVEPEPSDD